MPRRHRPDSTGPRTGSLQQVGRCLAPAKDPGNVLRVELAGLNGDTAVVTVSGEIDLRTAMTLRDHLTAVTQAGFGSIVVDFQHVRFCDASGLNTLVSLGNRVQAEGGGIWLAGVRPAQRRLFQITGLDRRFPLCHRVEDAVEQARLWASGQRS